MFPITIGNTPVIKGRLPDTSNPHGLLCHCGTFPYMRFGLKVGFWEPFALVDVTRVPFCFVSLGGLHFAFHGWGRQGDETKALPWAQSSFYNVHIYRFPLLQWLPIFSDKGCVEKGPFMLVYLSELDPTWSDEALSLIVHPETAAFSNRWAQLICGEDAIQSNVHLPNNALFWCAGSQGSLYPLLGNVAYHQSGVQASLLLLERASFLMHERGVFPGTKGRYALCHVYPMPLMQKSQYRYQLAYPAKKACGPFGRSSALWSANVERFNARENYSYVLWRKRNCCMGAAV